MTALEIIEQRAAHGMAYGDLSAVLSRLGNPEKKLSCIHIAGTNGKGSTAVLIYGVLKAAGYKTGLFTSPHIIRYSERICVNGENIQDQELEDCLKEVLCAEQAVNVRLNYFALTTAVALLYFKNSGVQYAILEVGLGGRLDPTNCIPTPVLAVITRIGLDHENILGNSIKEIVFEKAGIIKQGGDVVTAMQQKDALKILEAACGEKSAALYKAMTIAPVQQEGKHRLNTPYGEIELGLRGAYQVENAATALTAITILQEKGICIPQSAVEQGFITAQWPARFELLSKKPVILLDGAHNPMGALALKESIIEAYPGKRCVFALGMMRDKAYRKMLSHFSPVARAMVALPLPGERALSAMRLAEEMRAVCAEVHAADCIGQGLTLAQGLLREGDILVAAGSLYLAEPVRAFAMRKNRESL